MTVYQGRAFAHRTPLHPALALSELPLALRRCGPEVCTQGWSMRPPLAVTEPRLDLVGASCPRFTDEAPAAPGGQAPDPARSLRDAKRGASSALSDLLWESTVLAHTRQPSRPCTCAAVRTRTCASCPGGARPDASPAKRRSWAHWWQPGSALRQSRWQSRCANLDLPACLPATGLSSRTPLTYLQSGGGRGRLLTVSVSRNRVRIT